MSKPLCSSMNFVSTPAMSSWRRYTFGRGCARKPSEHGKDLLPVVGVLEDKHGLLRKPPSKLGAGLEGRRDNSIEPIRLTLLPHEA